MSIEFDEQKQQFTLHTAHTTMCMAVIGGGYLMSLYYGRRLRPSALMKRWDSSTSGFTPQYDGAPGEWYALNEIPLEYPTYGSGDYHEAALGVEFPDGSRLFDPVYVSHRIEQGTCEPEGLPGLCGGDQTLEITLRDAASGVTVCLYYGVYEQADVITRHARIVNTGKTPMAVTRALSANVDFQTADFDFLTSYGFHLEENQLCRTPLRYGVQEVGSRRGASGHVHNPFAILTAHETTESAGEAYGMALVYSGNFLACAQKDSRDRVRFQIGIHPDDFRWTLACGEAFTTPQAVLTYTADGLNDLSAHFHRVIRGHLGHSPWWNRPRPIVLNSWEGCYFDFDEERILEVIRHCGGLGLDMFVLDDGWFGAGDGYRRDDRSSLGDWYVAPQRFPRGLTPIIEACEEQGMAFGLWFEPEMISEDSELYRAHPDWAIGKPGRPYCRGRHQLILDLTREDVYAYLLERLTALLTEYRISYVKWDMNRHMTDAYSQALPPERQPELFHRYMLQLYRLLGEVEKRFPDLLIEGCSGGGGRFDMGMLYYCPQIWTSDDSDAIERLRIQHGTSLVYPPSAMTAHVSVCPNHQTRRVTDFATRGMVAMNATFGYEFDPCGLSDEERTQICEQTRQYRERQEMVAHGRFYRLESPFEHPYCAWLLLSEDGARGVLTFVLQAFRPRMRTVVRLQGLEPDADYRVTDAAGEQTVISGDELMYAGISIWIDRDNKGATYELERLTR